MNEGRRGRNNVQRSAITSSKDVHSSPKVERNINQPRSQNRAYNLEFDVSKKETPRGYNSSKNREYKLIDLSIRNDVVDNSQKQLDRYISPYNSMDEFKRVKKIIDEESMNVRKKKKKKRKKRKVISALMASFVILVILIVVCAVLMFTLPLFNLKNVKVYGSDRYVAEDIARSINLKIDENIFISMFRANTDNVKNDYPYIEELKIKYSFPNGVKFNIKERKDRYYALNKENSKYYIIDKNGYILDERNDTSLWDDEILVSGITFENKVVLGDKINDIDIRRLNSFENFCNATLLNLEGSTVTRVTFVNEYMKIYVNSSVEIVFETRKDVSDYSFALLKLILKDIEGQNGTIDMTRENPTFVKDN